MSATEYRCGCGAWMDECCEWSGPAAEMVVVSYTPECVRATASASGRSDTGAELVAVYHDCWDHIRSQPAFDREWFSLATVDPATVAEEAD